MKKKIKPLSNFKIFKEIIDKEFGGESKVSKMIMLANSNFKLAIRNSTIVDSNTILSKMKFLKRRIKLFLTRLYGLWNSSTTKFVDWNCEHNFVYVMNHSSIVANKVRVTPYHIKNDLTYLIYNIILATLHMVMFLIMIEQN